MLRSWFEGVLAAWMAGAIENLVQEQDTYRSTLRIAPDRVRYALHRSVDRIGRRFAWFIGMMGVGLVAGIHVFFLTIGVLASTEPARAWLFRVASGDRSALMKRLHPPVVSDSSERRLEPAPAARATLHAEEPIEVENVRGRWVCVTFYREERRTRGRRFPRLEQPMQLRPPRRTCIVWINESSLFLNQTTESFCLEGIEVPLHGLVKIVSSADTHHWLRGCVPAWETGDDG